MKKTDYIESFVDSTARIGKNTIIGKFCVIANNVSIGKNCAIDNHVVIYPGTTIGDSVNVQDNTIIGKPPISWTRSAKRLKIERQTGAQMEK